MYKVSLDVHDQQYAAEHNTFNKAFMKLKTTIQADEWNHVAFIDAIHQIYNAVYNPNKLEESRNKLRTQLRAVSTILQTIESRICIKININFKRALELHQFKKNLLNYLVETKVGNQNLINNYSESDDNENNIDAIDYIFSSDEQAQQKFPILYLFIDELLPKLVSVREQKYNFGDDLFKESESQYDDLPGKYLAQQFIDEKSETIQNDEYYKKLKLDEIQKVKKMEEDFESWVLDFMKELSQYIFNHPEEDIFHDRHHIVYLIFDKLTQALINEKSQSADNNPIKKIVDIIRFAKEKNEHKIKGKLANMVEKYEKRIPDYKLPIIHLVSGRENMSIPIVVRANPLADSSYKEIQQLYQNNFKNMDFANMKNSREKRIKAISEQMNIEKFKDYKKHSLLWQLGKFINDLIIKHTKGFQMLSSVYDAASKLKTTFFSAEPALPSSSVASTVTSTLVM